MHIVHTNKLVSLVQIIILMIITIFILPSIKEKRTRMNENRNKKIKIAEYTNKNSFLDIIFSFQFLALLRNYCYYSSFSLLFQHIK